MRKKIVAANWKMNLNYAEAMSLADALVDSVDDFGSTGIILAAPFVFLHELVGRIQSQPNFSVAAQNCSDKESGAFTGEVSASMLASVGVEHIIIGHSERRQLFGENDELIAAKVSRSLSHGLMPVFCCGESLSERKSSSHESRVMEQLERGLFHIDDSMISECIIAYEPVWAIGTGLNATPEEAQLMHAFIRYALSERYGSGLASGITILYGGSVTPQNAQSLFSCPDVDGGLVGGASLKANGFISIIGAMNSVTGNLPIRS